MTQKLGAEGSKSMWRLVVLQFDYTIIVYKLFTNLHVHVNNTVHVFFQVSQGMAKTYMQVSLNLRGDKNTSS